VIGTLDAVISTSPKLDLHAVNAALRGRSPQEILQWAVRTFGERLALQSSMQKTAGVLMHMMSTIAPQTEIVFVDTGVHFPETLATRDEFISRYELNIRTYAPRLSFDNQFEQYGRYLHETDDTQDGAEPGYRFCCKIRKEEPFIEAVRGRFDAVIGGLMRSEGGARAAIDAVTWDERLDAYKIYPLAFWSPEQVNAYTQEHDLPVHPLYARGFTSIGCFTCTTAIRPGEDQRAGRWRHIREANQALAATPLYCGINLEDVKKN